MDINSVANLLKGEAAVIAQAPISFFACVIVAAFVIWKVVQREYSNQLANANSRCELFQARAEDYERKLQGATPDEARARVEELEKRLRSVEPRQLNEDQIHRLTEVLRGGPAARAVKLDVASGTPDGASLQDGLIKAFTAAGWQVSVTMSLIGSPNALSRTGLKIGVANPANPDQRIRSFATELSEMGIQSEFAQGPPLAVHIIISTRLA